ncbi:hypothetical protein L2725_06385 [Shewanella corallii]|uniref:Uncharacterized protein n=2 Tax=Shewanella TaxID=22 RepID=A0ABT0N5J0_9GAMM|nr:MULTISPECIES: hypothetical protein [Shewanella]MCL1036932.1 hypothetical protein [Shewanella submarina]MCL2913415.1 hypothetical protein [Shewanella corallii]
MKIKILAATCLFGLSTLAQAEPLRVCNQDVNSVKCQAYLEGIVDGALIFKPNAMGERIQTDGYQSRALKYRGGKRYQEANRRFCADRLPDRDELVSAVTEAVTSGEIDSIEALNDAVRNLLDCQRLN